VVTVIACLVNSLGACMTMLFCLEITFGIPNFLFVLLTSTVTDTLYQCFVQLPLMVLYAKLIPEKIEASLFAFLMGISNLSNLFIARNIANLINLWIGATSDPANLETTVWKLYAIQGGMALIPLFFIWLIPKRKQVEKIQACIEYMALYEGKTEKECPMMFDDYACLDQDTAKRLKIEPPKESNEEVRLDATDEERAAGPALL